MSWVSLNIDYHNDKSELCELGRKYDTDKSSQRDNVSNMRHCHPYTLFYDSIFKNYKNEKLDIAELGILDGNSLLMWREYFKNANIFGYEYNISLIERFKANYDQERIDLSYIDVKNEGSIIQSLSMKNKKYDIIIDDTTHEFEDQIRIIKNAYNYLKPGGIFIIEDIFKRYNEHDYIEKLKDILHEFQDYYFVSLDHKNRNSEGWDNDKLFILIKAGGDYLFKNKNKITIITPSCRPENLRKLEKSINFNYVNEWIIVYDGSRIKENPYLFRDNEKVKEYLYKGYGISGNPQRNFALDKIEKGTYLYYLDDDNMMHKDFYSLLNVISDGKMYTFNQTGRLLGNDIRVGGIDTAMMLIDYKLCENERWIFDKYEADGYYIKSCYDKNTNSWIYVNNNLCYYNVI